MVRIPGFVAGLIAVVIMTPATQQPPRDAQLSRAGTASIAGVISRTDGPKGPLRHARVSVTGGELAAPRLDTTDDQGRFEIGGLPAGQYSVSASKAAYLAMNYGATRAGRQGTSIALADGQRATNVSIALPRGAVIAGTVTNAAGEPMPSVYVTLLHRRLYNGERRWLTVSGSLTNDRGNYRAYGLTAGDYLVVTQAFAEPSLPAEVTRLSDTDVDRLLQQARQPVQRTIASSSPQRPARIGFAPVFHPGTADGNLAATVTVAAGEERSGIDVLMDFVPMARVDGAVATSDASVMPPTQVALAPLGPPTPWEAWGFGRRLGPQTPDEQGRFSFVGVPPGEYSLIATTRPRPQRAGGAGPAPVTNSRLAYATVRINGADQNVSLVTQPGNRMSGRFVFDSAAAPASMPGARLMLEDLRISQGSGVTTYVAEPSSDGTFQIGDILPGRFKLSNEMRPGLAPTSGWALKSVASSGRDLLDTPFELRPTESLLDIVVTFTDRPAELAGTLQAPTGVPSSDYFIVVFSTNQAFWFPNSRRTTAARPNTNGEYSVRNLPPGEYFISAVTDVEDGEWFDPEFLNVLRASNPVKLTIGDGETKRQNLQIRR